MFEQLDDGEIFLVEQRDMFMTKHRILLIRLKTLEEHNVEYRGESTYTIIQACLTVLPMLELVSKVLNDLRQKPGRFRFINYCTASGDIDFDHRRDVEWYGVVMFDTLGRMTDEVERWRPPELQKQIALLNASRSKK